MTPFQIGNKTVLVDISRTKTFYEQRPRITDACQCEQCRHYEALVQDQELGILSLLQRMGVDPCRSDDAESGAIWHQGEHKAFHNRYLVFYKIFGRLMDPVPATDMELQTHPSLSLCDLEPHARSNYSLFQLDGDTLEFRIELYSDPK